MNCIWKSGHSYNGWNIDPGGSDHFNTAVGNLTNRWCWHLRITLALGTLGFLDDYVKLKEKAYKGMHGKAHSSSIHRAGIGNMSVFFLSPVTQHPTSLPMPLKMYLFHWGYSIFLSWLLC